MNIPETENKGLTPDTDNKKKGKKKGNKWEEEGDETTTEPGEAGESEELNGLAYLAILQAGGLAKVQEVLLEQLTGKHHRVRVEYIRRVKMELAHLSSQCTEVSRQFPTE